MIGPFTARACNAPIGNKRQPCPGSLHLEASPHAATIERPNLPLLLLQARERVLGWFRPVLNQHGLTEQQWRIIRALLDTGPLEPREIVSHCGISSPSLAGVLARMDDLGLVTRERLGHDQRRLRVSLTDRSMTLAASMAPQIEAAYDAIEARIGQTRMREVLAVLDDLTTALGPPADDPD